MRDEISKVMELTGAVEEQIKLHNDGYWSRAYVINGGEFVVKLPKYDTVSYENEAKFLRLLGSASHAVNTQRLKWLAEDNRCIVLFGVKGTPISNLTLSALQKQRIGEQIGAFLKELHTIKPDFNGQNLDAELLEYRKIYDDCADFYSKHFTKEEQKALDYLMYDYLPSERKGLGEKLVFSHADIWEPNILLDDNGKAGIIDCGNAGYFEEAADFVVEDEVLRSFILNNYGAGESLRKKSEIKYDMSTITCPKFGIPLWGEQVIVDKWVPLIRRVITKYSKKV